jgi:transposase
MPKPCSLELRERVVDAVESGASRREAVDWFEVSPRSAIHVPYGHWKTIIFAAGLRRRARPWVDGPITRRSS